MSITSNPPTIASLMGELARPAAQADPYPVYARMHELGEAMTMSDGTVVVTGYRACSAVLSDNRLRKEPGDVLTAAGYPDWQERPSLRMLFPVAVIGEMLGIPAEGRQLFQPWVADWTSVLEILNPLAVDCADAAAVQIDAYLRELVRARTEEPTGDLISALVADRGAGPCLDEDEVVTMAALILAAGSKPPPALLSNGLVALIDAPEQAALLRSRPELAKSAVEELLRYDTPVQMLYGRTAVEDMLVGEVEVTAGQRFVTIVGSANRDPRQFTKPGELRLDRDEGRPLSFGGGIHHCLGAALARLEAQVMVAPLSRRAHRRAAGTAQRPVDPRLSVASGRAGQLKRRQPGYRRPGARNAPRATPERWLARDPREFAQPGL